MVDFPKKYGYIKYKNNYSSYKMSENIKYNDAMIGGTLS